MIDQAGSLLASMVDKWEAVVVVYLDFSKAYDTYLP